MTEATISLPYRPLPKQVEAHGLNAKYRGFCGGWGNGKTSWGCVESFISLIEYPGLNYIIARKTRPELKSTTWDMFLNGDDTQPHGWHGLPKELIAVNNKSDLYLELKNGSRVHGLPLDDPKKLENYNLGGFWVDQAEEIEEEIFLKFHGRLRQLGAPREGLLTFNPNGHNWLWKRFIDPKRADNYKKRYKCIEASTYDNPNLPEDYLEQFEGLPEVWIQRFVIGSHEVFVGQIFTDYDPETHVIQPFRIPSTWERWLCIDPGIRHEGAMSWVARDPRGNCYYYREVLKTDQPIEWWATKKFELEAADDWGGPDERMDREIIGREALQRSPTDGVSVLDKWHEYGVYPELSDRDPVARISTITEYLRPKTGHTNPFTHADPAPRLYIFSDCEKLQEYLPQYKWKPQRIQVSEEDAPEKPRKKDDHNIDNLGHILLYLQDLPEPEEQHEPRDTEERQAARDFDKALENAEKRQGGTPISAAILNGARPREEDHDYVTT